MAKYLSIFIVLLSAVSYGVTNCSDADKNTLFGKYCKEDNIQNNNQREFRQPDFRTYDSFKSSPQLTPGVNLTLPNTQSNPGYDLPAPFVVPAKKKPKADVAEAVKSDSNNASSNWDYLKK